MADLAHLLEPGEHSLKYYHVKLAEFGGGGWNANTPWLRAVVTERRLILLPNQGDTLVQPIIIPLTDIQRVWNIGLGKRDGLMLSLKSGERMYMFVGWNQGRELMHDTQEMLAVKLPDEAKHL